MNKDVNTQNDTAESDPTVFLAKQVIEIRDQLKSDMESMKKEMSDMMKSEHKKDMDEIKKMLKDALND